MFGRKNDAEESKFSENTKKEVNKITPAGGNQVDPIIDFRPLWDAPRDSWERLIKANPQSARVDEETSPDESLLEDILAGETSSEVVLPELSGTPDEDEPAIDEELSEETDTEPAEEPEEVDESDETDESDELADDETAEVDEEPLDAEGEEPTEDEPVDEEDVPTVEPSLAYSEVEEVEEKSETTVLEEESPLAEVAKPNVTEAPDVQEKLDAEAAAPDATTSQNYIISMAAQRERREEKKRNTLPIFLGTGAAIVIVALLIGLGFAFPPKQLSRAEAQSTLRNAGVEALHKAPTFESLPPMALMVQNRTVTRTYEEKGISYSVTTTQKMVIGETTVDTDTLESDVTFATSQDRSRWEEQDKPNLPGMKPARRRPGGQQVQIAGTTINLDALAAWPRDIDGLSRTLARAIPGVQAARSAMLLASVPGLDRELYHGFFGVMARSSDTQIVDTPAGIVQDVPERVKTVQFPANPAAATTATITFDPNTGQVYAVLDATPQEKMVLVRATGFLNCIDTAGPKGPRNINMGCATGALYLEDLSWKGWGTDTAVGEGTTMINDCDPSCAEGTEFEFPVKVTLTDREPCGQGIDIYTKMTTTFPEGTDGLQPSSVEEEFPCPLNQ